MRVVVDASVVVKWLLPDTEIEPDLDPALDLLEAIRSERVEPVQPFHWLAEVAAVITRLRPQTARRSVELLYSLDFPVRDDLDVLRRAVTIATELSHHVFDTLYHAVALESGATLVTADDRYLRKARAFGHLEPLSSWPRWKP